MAHIPQVTKDCVIYTDILILWHPYGAVMFAQLSYTRCSVSRCSTSETIYSLRPNILFNGVILTRSQDVARIADRTASQHLWGHRPRDVIGYVTIL